MSQDGEEDDTEKSSRPRAGPEKHAELLIIFTSHFNTPVKLRDYGPKVDNKAIAEHKAMMKALYIIQPNLSFVPMVIKSCLVDLATSQKAVWKFSDTDIQRWASDVGPRIRLMCRHLAQAIGRPTPPSWAVSVIGAIIEAEPGAPRFADIRAWAGKKPPDGGEVELAPAPKRTRKN